jgi:hypothetical protein
VAGRELEGTDDQEHEEVKFTYRHLNHLGKLFWLLSILYAFITMSYFQFTNFVTDCLMQRFKYNYLDAKNLVALIPISTMIFIPLMSSVVSVTGKKGFALIIASSIATGIYWVLEATAA